MKTKALTLILFIFLGGFTNAQSEPKVEESINKNGVYVEFSGNSGNVLYFNLLGMDVLTMITINYERLFSLNYRNRIACRFGGGYFPQNWKYYSFPLELSYLYGSGIHNFEAGIGTSYLIEVNENNSKGNYFVFFGRIGYRYQGKKGLLLRVGFTPAVDPGRVTFTNRFPINPFAGISIGYSF